MNLPVSPPVSSKYSPISSPEIYQMLDFTDYINDVKEKLSLIKQKYSAKEHQRKIHVLEIAIKLYIFQEYESYGTENYPTTIDHVLQLLTVFTCRYMILS